MSSHGKAAFFRAMHAPEAPSFVIGNVSTAGMGLALERIGYRALATSSAGAAETLGFKDGGLPLDALLANAAEIVAASSLPVSADLENGRAEDLAGVAETYRRAAKTGLAGGSIEDALAPEADLFPLDVAVERLKTAIAAARAVEPDFVVTARCEMFLSPRRDLAEAIARLQAYEVAGADVLFAPGLPIDALPQVLAAIGAPYNHVTHATAEVDVPRLFALGVKRISLGAHLSRVAMQAAEARAAAILAAGA